MIYINDQIDQFDLAAALPHLSEQRCQQALRFRNSLGQRTCAAAYLLLCEGLRREYGIEEKPLFAYGEHGKPTLVGHPDIHFNLSHCREAAVCVLSNRPVGIDVESVSRYRESVARYTMNDSEMQSIQQSPRPDVAFTRLWTMKEALLKLSGHGLTDNLKAVLTNHQGKFLTVEAPDLRYIYSVAYASQQ